MLLKTRSRPNINRTACFKLLDWSWLPLACYHFLDRRRETDHFSTNSSFKPFYSQTSLALNIYFVVVRHCLCSALRVSLIVSNRIAAVFACLKVRCTRRCRQLTAHSPICSVLVRPRPAALLTAVGPDQWQDVNQRDCE